MALRVELYCDQCNPSQQRRDATTEVTHGFALVDGGVSGPLKELPPGWEIVALIERTGMPGHMCPVCCARGPHPMPERPVGDRAEAFGGRVDASDVEFEAATGGPQHAIIQGEVVELDEPRRLDAVMLRPQWPARRSPFSVD